MTGLVRVMRHPAALAVALVLGAAAGIVVPASGEDFAAVGRAYLAVLHMAATPLIVVAVFFGLRRVLALPRAPVRLAALSGAGLVALVLAGLLAAAMATLWGAGEGMNEQEALVLGKLSLDAEVFASVSLFDTVPAAESHRGWSNLVPDNFFHALAFGSLPAILVGALCFGFALAAQEGEAARSFERLMESIYRGLEVLIERLNVFLPVMAFALAASVASLADLDSMHLMRGFLGPFLLTSVLLVGGSAWLAAHHLGVAPKRVLQALRRPFVVGFFSGGPAAAVPGFIDAMCNQLGFRRDIVEFAAPLAPVFLRLGDALFFAVLAVFVAKLYGRVLEPADLLIIGLASAAGALASVTFAGGHSLAAGALMLGWLDLPADALLPVFLILEVLCEGLRTVLALSLTCALVTLASRGLPSEAPKALPQAPSALQARVRFVVSQGQAVAIGLLLGTALGAACLAGVGLGLRQGLLDPPRVSQTP